MFEALPRIGIALGPVQFWILAGAALIATAAGLQTAFRYLQRARILEDVPTARIRSAPQGYVELQGTSRLLDGPPVIAPLTRTRCTWWSYRVEERGRDRNNRWRTVKQATSEALFALEDDSGRCIVDPDGAEVFPMITRRWYGSGPTPAAPGASLGFAWGRYRYTEHRIHAGDPLYAIGEFRTRYFSDNRDPQRELGELLRAWKRDRAGLLERFDADRDGEIDLREWQAVRRAARAELASGRRQLDRHPGISVLAAPADGRPFLLGALPQSDLARQLRRRAIAGLATGCLGALAAAMLLAGRFG